MDKRRKYDPSIHHRRSIRLKGYDYSQAGMYFVTLCCAKRSCRFAQIADGVMVLNETGQVAYREWEGLAERFPNVKLDVFRIMPNHMHGIICMVGAPLAGAPDDNAGAPDDKPDGALNIDPLADNIGAGASLAPTGVILGDIIGAYKSLVANACLDICKSRNEIMGTLWQRNFYERIIRDVTAYERISAYIINNPANWKADKFYV